MNDETKKLLTEALKAVLDSLQSGISFAQREIPLILQEKLRYDFWYTVFELSAVTVIFLILTFLAVKSIRYGIQEDDEFFVGLGTVPMIIIVLVYFGIVLCDINVLLKIHLAPRLYLLEWLKEFIK